MAAAMRALHYPKAGALKMGCRANGAAFRCRATYRHHRVRRFYAAWAGERFGFVCAGSTAASCKILGRGFVPAAAAAQTGLQSSAMLVSWGYMKLHYDIPQPNTAPDCVRTTESSTWSFCYWATDTTRVNLTVHLAKVKAGYVTTVSEQAY